MTKTEFTDRLCQVLSRAGSPQLTESNRAFYTEYIDGETAKGRSEEEVLAELGEPELIANSILESKGFRDRFVDDDTKTYTAYDTPDGDPDTYAQGFEYREKNRTDGYSGASDAAGDSDAQQDAATSGGISKTKLIIGAIIVILVIIGIIALLIAVIGGIFKILGPILIPVLCIWIVYKLIKSISGK